MLLGEPTTVVRAPAAAAAAVLYLVVGLRLPSPRCHSLLPHHQYVPAGLHLPPAIAESLDRQHLSFQTVLLCSSASSCPLASSHYCRVSRPPAHHLSFQTSRLQPAPQLLLSCLTVPSSPPTCPPLAAESLDRQHITFQTVRPGDYPTPYELMLKQGVQFSAVDRKAGRLTTLMVRLCCELDFVVPMKGCVRVLRSLLAERG